MAIGDTYPGDPVGRRTLSRVRPSVSQETQGVSWTAPWKDLWYDSLTKKAATGIMNVARDVKSPGTRDLGEDITSAARFLNRTGTRDLSQDVSDYTKKYVTGGWKDLGEEIYTNIVSVPDTLLALGSGMLTTVAAPYAALPTLLKSDDPLTSEGSRDWTGKMHSVAENFPTYHARTPLGQSVTQGIGSLWEIWNNEVAARAGRGLEKALIAVGVDRKAAERSGAVTAGTIAAIPAVAPAVRVMGKETGSVGGIGHGWREIRQGRINALSNVRDPNWMARTWMQLDPVGYRKAIADGTFDAKLSKMGWEFDQHLSDMKVSKTYADVDYLGAAIGSRRFKPEVEKLMRQGLTEEQALREITAWGGPYDRFEISLSPPNIKEMQREYRELVGDELVGKDLQVTAGVPSHEFVHQLDLKAYRDLFPDPHSFVEFRKFLDELVTKSEKEGTPLPRTGDIETLAREWRERAEPKMFFGHASEKIPEIADLAERISNTEVRETMVAAQAVKLRELMEERNLPHEEAMNLIDWTEWHPPDYASKAEWQEAVTEGHRSTASPSEVQARLDQLQRFTKRTNVTLEQLIDASKNLENQPRHVLEAAVNMPSDLLTLVNAIDMRIQNRFHTLKMMEALDPATQGAADLLRRTRYKTHGIIKDSRLESGEFLPVVEAPLMSGRQGYMEYETRPDVSRPYDLNPLGEVTQKLPEGTHQIKHVYDQTSVQDAPLLSKEFGEMFDAQLMKQAKQDVLEGVYKAMAAGRATLPKKYKIGLVGR